MAWMPMRGGLVVTTLEEAETALVVVAYPVFDLVAFQYRGVIREDYDSLIELITVSVQPNTWKDTGVGEGTLEPFPGSSALVVTASWGVQEEIEALLEALRRVKTKQGIHGVPAARRYLDFEDTTQRDDDPPPPERSRRRSRVRWGTPERYEAPVVGGFF
jgi:hypothetical protein